MNLKKNLILRQVAATWVVLPIGEATVDFTGMLTLNNTGAVLWSTLEQGGNRLAMAEALTAEYDVTLEKALIDVDMFLDKLVEAGCIEA